MSPGLVKQHCEYCHTTPLQKMQKVDKELRPTDPLSVTLQWHVGENSGERPCHDDKNCGHGQRGQILVSNLVDEKLLRRDFPYHVLRGPAQLHVTQCRPRTYHLERSTVFETKEDVPALPNDGYKGTCPGRSKYCLLIHSTKGRIQNLPQHRRVCKESRLTDLAWRSSPSKDSFPPL